MCDDTLANKGAVDPDRKIKASDEFIRAIAQYSCDEFGGDLDDEIERILNRPELVSLLYTTFESGLEDDVDEDDDPIDHELQISVDLINMKWLIYSDNVLVWTEDLDNDDLGMLDWSTMFDTFASYACEMIPDDEQIANEHNPYMDEHRKLLEAVKKSNERLEVTRPLKEAIMNRFDIDDVTAWKYANNAYDDGQGLDDLVSILHDIQDDLRPERNY
jgi:hypothetical protein